MTLTTAQAQPSASTPPKPFGIVGSASGTGRWPAVAESLPALPGQTVYRPQALPVTPLPVVLWGNGACRDNGLQHAMFLREIASHGYYVIALGRPRFERGVERERKPELTIPTVAEIGTADETLLSEMQHALDWAAAENRREGSPLKGHLDLDKVAVMGHSCGGLQAIVMSADPRIRATIAFNSGIYNRAGPENRSRIKAGKDMLDKLHAPIAYFHGGPTDMAQPNAEDDAARIRTAPVFVGSLPLGHSGSFWLDENGGAWAKVGTAWLDWHLKGDPDAAAMFTGEACGLCVDPAWTVKRYNMK